jgi:hypothetical protein
VTDGGASLSVEPGPVGQGRVIPAAQGVRYCSVTLAAIAACSGCWLQPGSWDNRTAEYPVVSG